MPCPSFVTALQTSLWYTLDAAPSDPVPDGQTGQAAMRWHQIPFTGETLGAVISSTTSEQIRTNRTYFDATLTAAEVAGTITTEFSSSTFVYNMLSCVMQSPLLLHGLGGDPFNAGAVNAAITLESPLVTLVPLDLLIPAVGATYSISIDGTPYSCIDGSDCQDWAAHLLAEEINRASPYTAEASITLYSAAVRITGVVPEQVRFDAYASGEVSPGMRLRNGDTKHCLLILKAIEKDDGKYDYFLFRSVQVGSLAIELSPTALAQATFSLSGAHQETPLVNVSKPPYWQFIEAQPASSIFGADALKAFSITGNYLRASDLLLTSLTLTIDNQLRQQTAVGINKLFGAGVASGRMAVTLEVPIYYQNPRAFYELLEDSTLRLRGLIADQAGNGIEFLSDHVKVIQADTPVVDSAEQELLINTSFRAFECESTGSLELVRVPDAAPTLCQVLSIFDVANTEGAFYVCEPGEDAEGTYLFEDSAATIPATVGGVVGCVLDISTDVALPTRRNLVLESSLPNGMASLSSKSTFGLTDAVMPGFDGAVGVARDLQGNVVANKAPSVGVTDATSYVFSCFVSMDDGAGPPVIGALGVGDFSLVIQGAASIAPTIQTIGDNLYRISVSRVTSGTSMNTNGVRKDPAQSTRSFKVSGFQLELGTEPTIYQKIITGTADLIPGNHAFQQTTANKPILRQTPETGVYWLDSNTSTLALTATFNTALGSACTVVRATPEGVTFTENVTIGTTYNISPACSFNGEIMIVNRALTTSEKTLLTRYMGRRVPQLGPQVYVNSEFNDGLTGWSITFPERWSVTDGVLTYTPDGAIGNPPASQVFAKSGLYLLGIKYTAILGNAADISGGIGWDPATATRTVAGSSNIGKDLTYALTVGAGESIGVRPASAPTANFSVEYLRAWEIL